MNNNFLPKELHHKTINKLERLWPAKTKASLAAIFLGMLLLGLVQTSVNFTGPAISNSTAAASNISGDAADIVFGKNFSDPAEQEQILEKQVKLVASRPAFVPSLYVVKKHEDEIRRVARAKGLPEEIALGIFFLENGGSENAVSVAGAAGIAQLMPGTAREMGLVVNRGRDDRLNPNLAIEAGLTYLAGNLAMLGDPGLAAWSYHAGAGNVCKAVRVYAESAYGDRLEGGRGRNEYGKNRGITVHKVLSNAAVQRRVTSGLYDDSAGYPYKVMATAHLFELNKKLKDHEFLRRVVLLNADALKVKDLFKS